MADITILCKNCDSEFVFTEDEQVFYTEKGFTYPKACLECRRVNKETHITSRKLKEFIKEIQFVNRNPIDNSVLKMLQDLSTNPSTVLHKGDLLYRARIIKKYEPINKEPNFWGFDKKGSFIPLPKDTKDMRANYRNIPYLYCANDPYVAVAEVRPRLGAKVSIATIEVISEMEILNFNRDNKAFIKDKVKQNLFDNLSELFSKPVTSDDDIIDYIPTQYIAEYVKNLGYAGLRYWSSLVMEMPFQKSENSNIVIFDYKKCEPVKSNVYKIEATNLECVSADEDSGNTMLVESPVYRALSKV